MKNEHKKENIFNLTVQCLEKYSSTVPQLAFKGWHQVKRQDDLLTGGGKLEMVELKDHQQ